MGLFFAQMVWLETPTNPLLKYIDIKKVCDIAHQHDIVVVVDNTFLSSYFQVREMFRIRNK